MLVLDEQLIGRGLEDSLRRWYRGSVLYITDLRPGTVIKDEAIPDLLRRQPQPTFVTINDRDFWQRTAIDARFAVVCFPLPDSRVGEIPDRLRAVLRLERFRTKRRRMGIVLRVTSEHVSYYTAVDREVRTFPLSRRR